MEGIDIANAPGSSYTSYGDEDVRGVRLFRFTEFNVRDYETLHVLYSDYNTPASFGYLRYYFSTTTGIYNAVKVVLSILIVIVAIVVTIIVMAVRKKRRKATAAAEAVLPAETKNESTVETEQKE